MAVQAALEHGKHRRGVWTRPGAISTNPMAPGSYAKYVLIRSAPRPYPKTPQQARIGEAGRKVGEQCKGQKGEAFYSCRRQALSSVRKEST